MLELLAKARAQGVVRLKVTGDGFEAEMLPTPPAESKARLGKEAPVFGPDGEELHGEEAELERGLFVTDGTHG